MARTTQLILSLAVALALAMPSLAEAQATRRGGSSGSGSGSSGSGSGSGSSGSAGSSGSTSSGGARRVAPPSSPRTGSAVRRGSEGASRAGSATSRGTGSTSTSGADSSRLRTGRSLAVGRPGSAIGAGANSFGVERNRDRSGRPLTGVAMARPQSDVRIIYYPFVGPWGRWYPWYSAGFGWGGLGYLAYDPFYSSYYYRYPYGYPYNIYNRAPAPYLYEDEEADERLGSIRFRVEPEEARVYVNGALVGTVDDFNGLKDHLELPAGVHQLEIRAEGYETYTAELTVEPGKTTTERFSLTKRQ